MRRRRGRLTTMEAQIFQVVKDMCEASDGDGTTHGRAVATRMGRDTQQGALGSLYRALQRLEEMGLLHSVMEKGDIADERGTPRRRLYRLANRRWGGP